MPDTINHLAEVCKTLNFITADRNLTAVPEIRLASFADGMNLSHMVLKENTGMIRADGDAVDHLTIAGIKITWPSAE